LHPSSGRNLSASSFTLSPVTKDNAPCHKNILGLLILSMPSAPTPTSKAGCRCRRFMTYGGALGLIFVFYQEIKPRKRAPQESRYPHNLPESRGSNPYQKPSLKSSPRSLPSQVEAVPWCHDGLQRPWQFRARGGRARLDESMIRSAFSAAAISCDRLTALDRAIIENCGRSDMLPTSSPAR